LILSFHALIDFHAPRSLRGIRPFGSPLVPSVLCLHKREESSSEPQRVKLQTSGKSGSSPAKHLVLPQDGDMLSLPRKRAGRRHAIPPSYRTEHLGRTACCAPAHYAQGTIPASLTWGQDGTETEAVALEHRFHDTTVRHPAEVGVVEPTAAAKHAARARG
jgi:hypothetical protein